MKYVNVRKLRPATPPPPTSILDQDQDWRDRHICRWSASSSMGNDRRVRPGDEARRRARTTTSAAPTRDAAAFDRRWPPSSTAGC
ncbi:MAG: hypothetical protein MZV64_34805 [Ignavibacteriales bacterium]|nr:hypothetical protein [Ignavibacteriales bacterium]